MALTEIQIADLRRAPVSDSGNRVNAAMELLDLTQARLAEAIGLTQPYVSDVARGRFQTITLDNARKFSDYFGCSIEDLFPAKAQVA